MPNVKDPKTGKVKHFPYNAGGIIEANRYAKKVNSKVTHTKNKRVT